MERETLTIEQTAKLLGMSKQGVRIQIQRGILPFGVAVKSVEGNEHRYIIPRRKVYEFLGMECNENEVIE